MPQINHGMAEGDWQNNDLVTPDRLNRFVKEATIANGAITEKPALPAGTVAADDQVLGFDASGNTLVKVAAADLVGSNLPVTASTVTTNTINAPAGESITLTPNDGTVVTGNAFSSVDGLNVLVNKADHGLTVGQLIEVSEAISGVIAKPAYNGKYKVTEVTSTSVFVYRLDTATDPITGTLSYKREGAVVINNNLQVNGESRFYGNLRFDSGAKVSGNLEFLNGNLQLPNGTTAQRPTTPLTGVQRFNTTTNRMEFYNGTEWANVVQSATIEALTGWLFLGYQTVEVNGSTSISGTGTRTLPLFEHNIAIPEGEYWLPDSNFAIANPTKTTDLVLSQACVSNGYDSGNVFGPVISLPMRQMFADMSFNFSDKKISSYRTYIPNPTNIDYWIWDSSLDIGYGGYAEYIYSSNSDGPDVFSYGYKWTVNFVWNKAPTEATNAYEANLHVNAFTCTLNRSSHAFSDRITDNTETSALFYLIPQNQTSPDPVNGTLWISEKGIRGGQNIKIRRKSVTFNKTHNALFQERFVLVFERWKRA